MFTERFQYLTVVALLILLGGLVVACQPAVAQPGAAQVVDSAASPVTGGITVVGRGEAMGQPDLARLQAGVESFAESVGEATAANEATIQAILAALEAQGIPNEDIQTSNYNLWAEQRYSEEGPQGITGYRVSNMVTVVVRDIDQVGEVIAAVTEAGANNIHGISFDVAEPAALEAAARAEAIANARDRAESLAELAGIELGQVLVISEVIGHSGVPVAGMGGRVAMDEMAQAETAPSIAPGELSFTISVQVTYGIE